MPLRCLPGRVRLGRRVRPPHRRYAWGRRQLPRNRRHHRSRRPNRPGHRRPTRNRLHSHDKYRLDEGVVGSGMGLFLIVGHWQCCGSGMFNPDPNFLKSRILIFFHTGSQMFPDPPQRICVYCVQVRLLCRYFVLFSAAEICVKTGRQ
jgi:hypothetical protein